MQEVLPETHEVQDKPVDIFYQAVLAQERLRESYLAYRLAQISAPFSEATKRQIWEWQKLGHSTRWISDELGVTRYKVRALVNRQGWPSPTNLA